MKIVCMGIVIIETNKFFQNVGLNEKFPFELSAKWTIEIQNRDVLTK